MREFHTFPVTQPQTGHLSKPLHSSNTTHLAQAVDLTLDEIVAEGIESDAVIARDPHDARGRVVRVEPDPETDLLCGHRVQSEILGPDSIEHILAQVFA